LGGKTLPKVKRIITIPIKKEQIHFAIKRLGMAEKIGQRRLKTALRSWRNSLPTGESPAPPLTGLILAIKLFYRERVVEVSQARRQKQPLIAAEAHSVYNHQSLARTGNVLLIIRRYSVTG
jgi:hypothetical protein